MKKTNTLKAKGKISQKTSESEIMYHAIFEATGTATLIVDEDTTISMANRKCFLLTGYNPDELIGQKWVRFVLPEYLEVMKKNHDLRRTDPDKAPKNYEVKLVNKNGESRDVILDINMIPNTKQSVVSLLDITDLKKAENDLKIFRTLIENSNDSIEVIDPKTGKFLDVNQKMCTELGYSREELLNMSVPDIDPEIEKDTFHKVPEVFSNTDNILMESVHVRKDGSRFPVELNIRYIQLDKPYIVSIARNITERKHSEMLINEVNKEYKDIFYFAPVGIYQSSRDGAIINANQKFAELLGYKNADEVLGLNMSKDVYWNPGDREKFIGEYESKGVVHNLEICWKKKDGTQIWIMLSSHIKLDDNNSVVFFEGFVRDITDQKMAEEKLFLQSSALESAANGILITDLNGKIEWANKSFLQLTGYSIEEVLNKYSNILKSGYQDDKFYKNIWGTILAGKVWNGELINKRKDGSFYNEEMTITPVRDKNNKIRNFIAIKQDVSDRKKTQNDLILAIEKAELSNKLKDAFIANISHEIRTPLNGILGMTSLIKNSLSPYLKVEDSNCFKAIEYSSSRIVRTIDMILNFSRLQVGEFTVNKKQISLPLIINNLINEYKSKASGKSLKLFFVNKLKTALILADEYSIAQAISNLIDNAVKYTAAGSVTLTLYKDKSHTILLEVKDTGIGISKDYLDKIFEPYTQEEIGYSRSYEGVGLGMSLVKKYLDLNGADISVNSEKNKGTSFTVNFGQSIKNVPQVNESIDIVHKEISDFKKMSNFNILVIEDDAINQMYLISLLKKNCQTDSAFSAEQARKKLKLKKYDLILMDISLKGKMNGLELTKLLRKTKDYKNVPIIAVTGHSSDDDKDNCFNAGCNEFLSKPFNENELFEKILKFTHKRKKIN